MKSIKYLQRNYRHFRYSVMNFVPYKEMFSTDHVCLLEKLHLRLYIF